LLFSLDYYGAKIGVLAVLTHKIAPSFGFKAKQMPTDAGHLKRIVKLKYPFVESHLNEILYNIKNALQYSHLYEGIPEQLKKERLEQVCWASMDFYILLVFSECFMNVLTFTVGA
jgi:hypothetical protein